MNNTLLRSYRGLNGRSSIRARSTKNSESATNLFELRMKLEQNNKKKNHFSVLSRLLSIVF